MGIGSAIAQRRKTKGWSQKQLAVEASISQASLHYIESGENSPTVNTLKKIADALGVPVTELLDDNDQEPTKKVG